MKTKPPPGESNRSAAAQQFIHMAFAYERSLFSSTAVTPSFITDWFWLSIYRWGNDDSSTMKQFLILLAMVVPSLVGRADLVINEQSVQSDATNELRIQIHDSKIRIEQLDVHGDSFIGISDLATLDSLMLIPKDKTVLKRSGAKVKSDLATLKKQLGETNAAFAAPAKPIATGKTEKIGGYETEIYLWAGPQGLRQTLWVAKNFPDYATIKTDRDKLDEWNASGLGKNAQPDLRLLPGMVVKTETITQGRTVTVWLKSAETKPVDPAVFEVPGDYTEWKPPATPTGHPAMPLHGQ